MAHSLQVLDRPELPTDACCPHRAARFSAEAPPPTATWARGPHGLASGQTSGTGNETAASAAAAAGGAASPLRSQQLKYRGSAAEAREPIYVTFQLPAAGAPAGKQRAAQNCCMGGTVAAVVYLQKVVCFCAGPQQSPPCPHTSACRSTSDSSCSALPLPVPEKAQPKRCLEPGTGGHAAVCWCVSPEALLSLQTRNGRPDRTRRSVSVPYS